MAQILSWINSNWFPILQTVGVIAYFRLDTNTRRVSNIIAIAQRHEDLWAGDYHGEDLKRVSAEHVDLLAEPATIAEIEYLRNRAVQFESGWEIAVLMQPRKLKPLALDIAEFLSLPLPRAVWEKVKKFRDPKFVRFVERAVERDGQLNAMGS